MTTQQEPTKVDAAIEKAMQYIKDNLNPTVNQMIEINNRLHMINMARLTQDYADIMEIRRKAYCND